MNFLCVDDSATMRKIVSMTLSGMGHAVAEAENGKKALGALMKNGRVTISHVKVALTTPKP